MWITKVLRNWKFSETLHFQFLEKKNDKKTRRNKQRRKRVEVGDAAARLMIISFLEIIILHQHYLIITRKNDTEIAKKKREGIRLLH